MRLFYSTLLVTVISLTFIATVSAADDENFLGSHDDIIINNTSSTTIKANSPTIGASTYSDINDLDTLQSATPAMPKAEKIANTQRMEDVSTEVVRKGGAVSSDPMISRVDTSAPTPYKPMVSKRNSVVSTAATTRTVEPAPQALANTTYASAPTPPAPTSSSEIPPNARAGECYAKVLIPAVTENKSKRIQVSEERKVLARIIPAQYKVQTERVKVSEGRKYWKQGRGPIEKTNQLTGEILCLIEEPPQYKTIEKRVLVSPEKPEYRMEPAQFETITKTNTIQAERLEWRRILCETNVTPQVVMNIQKSLQAKGYSVGSVDGRFGNQTLQAISQYQSKNGLASRGITYETLNSLGVNLSGV